VLSMWTCKKYFSHPSLVFFFFPTLPMKLKLEFGTANRWETTNSKPPGPIIMIGQLETGSNTRSYLLHSSMAGVRLVVLFTTLRKLCKNAGPKPFC
jgi:hypothetical protein